MAALDGGWGWVVMVASFVIIFISGGITRSFSVWYLEILDRFEASAALSTWVIGVHMTVRLCFYPLYTMLYGKLRLQWLIMTGGVLYTAGILISAFVSNIFQLFLSYSILSGFGSGLVSFGYQMALSEYFEKRRLLAFGLATAGVGVGNAALPPLISYMFTELSYQETIFNLAALSLQLVVAGALCFPIYEPAEPEKLPLIDTGRQAVKIRKLSGKKRFEVDLLLNPVMIVCAFGAVLSMMGNFPALQLVVSIGVERGLSLTTASLLMTVSGIVETASRPILGIVLNLPAVRPRIVELWNCCPIGFGLSTLAIAYSLSFGQFLPGICINAVFYAINRAFAPSVFGEMFESSAFASAFSIYSNVMGIGTLTGTALSGYMKDEFGSYVNSYLVMTGCNFAGAVCLWLSYFLMRRLRNNPKYRLKTKDS